MIPKIVILFSGSGSNLCYILENMHKKSIEVVAAITNNPNAGGIEYANRFDIPVTVIDHTKYSSREDFDKELVKEIQKYNPNLTVLAGFMRILTPLFTQNIKAINLHPSLLPRNKGLNAIKRSFEDEFDDGGVTIHYVTEELDSGDIIIQKSISKDGLDYSEYYNKIREIEKEALKLGILKSLGI